MSKFWQIKFTDPETGERRRYMNIGFKTKESAERELSAIKLERERFRKTGRKVDPHAVRKAGLIVSSVLIGTHWRISPIK